MENRVLRKWKERKNSNLQDIVHENDVPLLWRQVDMVVVSTLASTHLYTWVKWSTAKVVSYPRTQHGVPGESLNQGSALTMRSSRLS